MSKAELLTGAAKRLADALATAGRDADGAKLPAGVQAEKLVLPGPAGAVDEVMGSTPIAPQLSVPKSAPMAVETPAVASDPFAKPDLNFLNKGLQDWEPEADVPLEVLKGRQTETLKPETVANTGFVQFDTASAPDLTKNFAGIFGNDPTEDDKALLLAFGHGYAGKGKEHNLKAVDNLLKVSASILEAAPEVAKIDTVFKFSNGAPVIQWRAANLRELLTDPLDMFRERISNPMEIGAHAGTYDQAITFVNPTLNQMRNDLGKGAVGAFEAGVGELIRRALPGPHKGYDRAVGTNQNVIDSFNQYMEYTSDFSEEAASLMQFADEKGVVSDEKVRQAFFNEGFGAQVVAEFKRILEINGTPEDDIATAVAGFEEGLKREVVATIKGMDKGRGISKRHGQMVPFIPVVKKPLLVRDVTDNSADNLVSAFKEDPSMVVPAADIKTVEEIIAIWEQGPATDKHFQDLLKSKGYDALQYVNTAEGTGARMSIVVFDEANIRPLHEVIPALKNLKESLRKRVYNLMAVGVPLTTALQAIQLEEEDGTDV